MQLIFHGKSPRSMPDSTIEITAAHVHLAHSANHWSSQESMQQYVKEVIIPYAERKIQEFQLHSDAHILLVLDVWAVHKSQEFRKFLHDNHSRIHLVFVPARCTSKLQVADVALQRPFKNHIKNQFEDWAASVIREQIRKNETIHLDLSMATLKPLVVKWCISSWSELKDRKNVILGGWANCCTKLYNVHDPKKRTDALVDVINGSLDLILVPEETVTEKDKDLEVECNSDSESDSESAAGDELDLTVPIAIGERRSTRVRKQTTAHGYQIDSQAIQFEE